MCKAPRTTKVGRREVKVWCVPPGVRYSDQTKHVVMVETFRSGASTCDLYVHQRWGTFNLRYVEQKATSKRKLGMVVSCLMLTWTDLKQF
jgi:hypothetical protein